MKTFQDEMLELRDKCLRCFAKEIGDLYPRGYYLDMAAKVMNEYGNPDHSPDCDWVKARLLVPRPRFSHTLRSDDQDSEII